jgi:hypothetical protein
MQELVSFSWHHILSASLIIATTLNHNQLRRGYFFKGGNLEIDFTKIHPYTQTHFEGLKPLLAVPEVQRTKRKRLTDQVTTLLLFLWPTNHHFSNPHILKKPAVRK